MASCRVHLLICFFLALGQTVWAQSSAQLKKQREALTREINLLNKSLQSTSNDRALSLKQVNALNAQLNLRAKKISTITNEVAIIEREIRENTKNIRELESQLSELRKDYAKMVQFAYRNKGGYGKLMFIFASDDFNQAYKRLKYLQQFSESRKKQAQEIEATQKKINATIAELNAQRKEQSALLADQEKEKKVLDEQKGVKSKALANLTSQEKEYKQELAQKQQEDARLARAIQSAIRREIEEARKAAEAEAARKAAEEAKKNEGTKSPEKSGTAAATPKRTTDREALLSTPEAAKLAAEFNGNRGRLPWPVSNGTVTQGFGQYTYGAGVKVNSNGLNIRTSPGSPVRAVFNGTVSSVIQIQNQYTVIVKHGNYFTVYQNLKSVSVSKGTQVSTKQALGTVAVDASEGTSDLHFEIWQSSTPINPAPWLAGN